MEIIKQGRPVGHPMGEQSWLRKGLFLGVRVNFKLTSGE
jgi:hypothetical protein